MGFYEKCPECGSTNYENQSGVRYFECGFASDVVDKRGLCESDAQQPVADYHQALIHFAHALDAITEDLQKDDGPVDYIVKYKMLARDALTLAGGDDKVAITHDKTWADWMKNWSR